MIRRHEEDEIDDIAERTMEEQFRPSLGLLAVVLAFIGTLGYLIAC